MRGKSGKYKRNIDHEGLGAKRGMFTPRNHKTGQFRYFQKTPILFLTEVDKLDHSNDLFYLSGGSIVYSQFNMCSFFLFFFFFWNT